MWFEFFKFDLRYQLRHPLLWVSALAFGLLAFGASSSDSVTIGGAIGNVHRNAPMVVAQFLGMFTILSMFIVTVFMAGAVLRDTELGMADMIFATPMRKRDYVLGRFAGGLVACLVIFVVVAIGIALGPFMPWVDPQRVGPHSLWPYLWGFGVLVLPNLLFIGALLVLLAVTTRSVLLVYVGVIGFFVLHGLAELAMADIANEWMGVLLDPFGLSAFSRMTRYFTVAEANASLPPLAGFLLANRVLWSAVGLLLLGLALWLFKPLRSGTGKTLPWQRQQAKLPAQAGAASGPLMRRTQPVPHTTATAWRQCWALFKFDALGVFKSVPFLVMLLFGLINFVGGSLLQGRMYGTEVYPVTRFVMENMRGSYTFMLILIVTFYAGELVFKERQAKVADVSDAMPVPDWVPLLAKCAALLGVVLAFMLCGVLAGLGFQLVRGGVALEPGVYVQLALATATPFVLMGLLAVALQVLTNNKFVGYLAIVLVLVLKVLIRTWHLDHNLYTPLALPGAPYSDMNGFGHFLAGWGWFLLYWCWLLLGLLVLSYGFWQRGQDAPWRTRWALARQRLRGAGNAALAVCVLGFAATGGWIYYNTNVLNEYVPGDVAMDRQANYEKLYKQYQRVPQPRLTDVQADVDIYPQERRVQIQAKLRLVNKQAQPIDTLYVYINPMTQTELQGLPAHTVKVDDKLLGMHILQLAQPLAPGAALDVGVAVTVQQQGFTNWGEPNKIHYNGTFFNNSDYLPILGYMAHAELTDRNERRKRGLGEPQRMPKLEDEAARADNALGESADWINFDTTVSTSADQIALAPGYLQKTWEAGGRRYFHYKMDQPMLAFFPYLSARWQVAKGDWHGLPIEIYHDPKHAYNAQRMILATQKSLDYYSANFTPYQHKQVRILEFPLYASFAQSFANTIPFSESIGFIADLRDPEDVDYVFFVTAHEMAHQWWAHQVIGGNVQGSTMLMESLAQYSALMVMEKEYGREHMRRFLKQELDGYLSGRGREPIEELPLYRVEGQPYIHYNKGALVFYRLRDEIGEAALNRALKRFLQDKGFQQPPYTTSKELLDYIRAETPKSQQELITDLFEKIVLYDNRVTEASAKQRPDGQWDVTFKLHLAKLQADGKGQETPRNYDEPVEIAVFARAPGAKESQEKVLFSDKRRLQGPEPVLTVTVKEKPFEVGVDPYNLLIDRVPSDNRKQVTVQ